MTGAARSRKKRSLGSFMREQLLMRRYRASRCAHELAYDWAAIRYNRIAIVNLLLSANPGGRYLEIGCADNLLFDAVMAAQKVGVDPVSGGTHRQTSDAFFGSAREGLFDVIFIDGLHVYDQVRRDVEGALRVVKAGGWIALHDMLPRDWVEEHVPQISTGAWTGDGWKVAFELMQCPGIDFRVIAVDHGVAVVRVLGEAPQLPDLRSDLSPRRFAYFYEHFATLPVVDFAAGRAWIEAQLA